MQNIPSLEYIYIYFLLSQSWWYFCSFFSYCAHLFIFADVILKILSTYLVFVISQYTCLFSNLLVWVNNFGMFSVLHFLLFLMLTKQKYLYPYTLSAYIFTRNYGESLQKLYVYKIECFTLFLKCVGLMEGILISQSHMPRCFRFTCFWSNKNKVSTPLNIFITFKSQQKIERKRNRKNQYIFLIYLFRRNVFIVCGYAIERIYCIY